MTPALPSENTFSCPTVDYGVENDGIGNLSGYAWDENVGWINFNPTGGGVTLDANGNFDSWSWGEHIGWIHFQNISVAPFQNTGLGVTAETIEEMAI